MSVQEQEQDQDQAQIKDQVHQEPFVGKKSRYGSDASESEDAKLKKLQQSDHIEVSSDVKRERARELRMKIENWHQTEEY